MKQFSTIFKQILAFIPRETFNKGVKVYQSDRYVKKFSTWSQFLANFFAQIYGVNSLREIVTALKPRQHRWYHLGLSEVKRSTLAHANRMRNSRVFEFLFYQLFERFQRLTPRHKFRFKNPLYSLDATSIELCLSLYPWAEFRRKKGAIKLHYLLSHRGEIPAFLVVSDGKMHEVTAAKEFDLPLSSDSIVAVDRGYLDFEWLWQLNLKRVFFVTRAKSGLAYRVIGQQDFRGKDVLNDEIIELRVKDSSAKYPGKLRLVTFLDRENEKVYRFLTNNFRLSAATIAAIYKERWKIETFFKWIKQNLNIQSFLGTTPNAVLTQIWTAMIFYLLLNYLKFQTRFRNSLLELTIILRVMLFEMVSLIDLMSLNISDLHKLKENNDQGQFF